jgi:hypothetical protein
LSKSSEEAALIFIVIKIECLVDKKGKNHIFLELPIKKIFLFKIEFKVFCAFSVKGAKIPVISIATKTTYFIKEGRTIAYGVHKKIQ